MATLQSCFLLEQKGRP